MKTEFNKEINRILSELYNNPMEQIKHIANRAIIQTEYRYVEYLVSIKLVKLLNNNGNGSFSLQLENKGYEVFEKYKGWNDYRIKVVERKEKIERSKELAQKFWWLPVIISLSALILSIVALIFKK